MKNRVLFTIIIALAFINSTFAQILVEGIIIDKSDSLPLPGVLIKVKFSDIGTVSNLHGKYSLTVPDSSSIIEYSLAGMKNIEITINGRNIVNVILEWAFTDNYILATTDTLKLHFIPKAFNDVKLGVEFDEKTACHPVNPKPKVRKKMWEGIQINIPAKIFIGTNLDTLLLTIPFCTYEYYRGDIDVIITEVYVEDVKEGIQYMGVIDYELEIIRADKIASFIIPNPANKVKRDHAQLEALKQQMFGKRINLNLLDFVKIPIKSGKYKVYAICAGFKSNIMNMEIIVEK
jgi:hypothetical protein